MDETLLPVFHTCMHGFSLFPGSILFPTKEHVDTSETKQSFQGEFAKRPDMIRLAGANIKLEGMHAEFHCVNHFH